MAVNETLIVIVGSPRKSKSGDYETARYKAAGFGESVDARITPLLGLVELYKPSHLIAVCTAEAKDSFDLFLDEWKESGLCPELVTTRFEIDLLTHCQTADSLLRKLAEITPTTENTHLDVTFGPRFISVAALLSALVQKTAGRWNLTRLTYVNYEARPRTETALPIPVEDLTIYLALPVLALGVDALKKRGDIAAFAEGIEPFLKVGENLAHPKDLAIVVEAVSLLRVTSLMHGDAKQSLGRLIGALRKISENSLLTPLLSEAEFILNSLRPPEDSKSGSPQYLSQLVRWYQDHNQPEKALLLASEALTFCVCMVYLNLDYPNNHYRKADEYYNRAQLMHKEDKQKTKMIVKSHQLFQYIKEVRANYAHASLISKNAADSARVSVDEINRLLEEFHEVCKSL